MKQRSQMVPPRQQRRSDIATDARAEPTETGPSSFPGSRHAVRYGIGLLLVALCVGLAAALFLTIGTARAGVFLVSTNALF